MQVGSQMELACRSCRQQFWGVSASAIGSLPTQESSAEIPGLFAQMGFVDVTNGGHSGLELAGPEEVNEVDMGEQHCIRRLPTTL